MTERVFENERLGERQRERDGLREREREAGKEREREGEAGNEEHKIDEVTKKRQAKRGNGTKIERVYERVREREFRCESVIVRVCMCICK